MSKWGMFVNPFTAPESIHAVDTVEEIMNLIEMNTLDDDVTGHHIWVTGYNTNGINISGMERDTSHNGIKMAILSLTLGGKTPSVFVYLSDRTVIIIQRLASQSKCEMCVHDFVDRLHTMDTTLEDEREMCEEDRFEYKLPLPSSLTHQHRWEHGRRNGFKFRRCSCGLKQVHFGYSGSVWATIDMIPEGVQF